MKLKQVPTPPTPDTVLEKANVNLKGWITYFEQLSSRVTVIPSWHPEFDVKKWKKFTAVNITKDKEVNSNILIDWPENDKIAFFLKINSSYSKKIESTAEDLFVFCFDENELGKAFGVTYFEWLDSEFEGPDEIKYFLGNFSAEALSRKYIASIVKRRLEAIENSVPGNVPPSKKK